MITALQNALRTMLLDDATLSDALSGIFDLPRADAKLPYGVIGPITVEDLSTKTEQGRRVLVQLTLFDSHGGAGPARRLAAQAEQILRPLSLADPDWMLVSWRHQQTDILFDPTDRIAQAILRFEARLYQSS